VAKIRVEVEEAKEKSNDPNFSNRLNQRRRHSDK